MPNEPVLLEDALSKLHHQRVLTGYGLAFLLVLLVLIGLFIVSQ